ncbi:hypothetical protein TNCV_1180981 [Trichonephila clavipes]|nr:hypothetical protein TNCV_1180981 [Trichonephila clavipes]
MVPPLLTSTVPLRLHKFHVQRPSLYGDSSGALGSNKVQKEHQRENSCHSERANRSSRIVTGGKVRDAKRLPRKSHTCSMGLRSGDRAG